MPGKLNHAAALSDGVFPPEAPNPAPEHEEQVIPATLEAAAPARRLTTGRRERMGAAKPPRHRKPAADDELSFDGVVQAPPTGRAATPAPHAEALLVEMVRAANQDGIRIYPSGDQQTMMVDYPAHLNKGFPRALFLPREWHPLRQALAIARHLWTPLDEGAPAEPGLAAAQAALKVNNDLIQANNERCEELLERFDRIQAHLNESGEVIRAATTALATARECLEARSREEVSP